MVQNVEREYSKKMLEDIESTALSAKQKKIRLMMDMEDSFL